MKSLYHIDGGGCDYAKGTGSSAQRLHAILADRSCRTQGPGDAPPVFTGASCAQGYQRRPCAVHGSPNCPGPRQGTESPRFSAAPAARARAPRRPPRTRRPPTTRAGGRRGAGEGAGVYSRGSGWSSKLTRLRFAGGRSGEAAAIPGLPAPEPPRRWRIHCCCAAPSRPCLDTPLAAALIPPNRTAHKETWA